MGISTPHFGSPSLEMWANLMTFKAPMEAKVKILRELFSYTQTQQAKVLGAWVIIPGCLAMAGKEMWSLAVATQELIHGMSFWESFPYVASCATVFAITGCFKMVVIRLRREYPLAKAVE